MLLTTVSCTSSSKKETVDTTNTSPKKIVVYQVFTRLFGNTNTTNKPWGTIEENGVGKFNDFTDKALQEIRDLGVTHIWYTGVPHHALVNDYTEYGISNDDPDVVKGRAGSPYAVKDYYNVNPDLAVNVEDRLNEFKALIDRTHKQHLKVIIDIVPNHVARHYESISKPAGISDFGAGDNANVEYNVNNNFYYIPNQPFIVPEGIQPLGGEAHPLADNKFDENPAKWTGNGSRLAQPSPNDWYETVKINYGIKPDGTKDFPLLPADYDKKPWQEHYTFWQNKTVPNSWIKFKDIALYWTKFGVDGFRFDMAEMVPVEFWSFMNSSIKNANPQAFILAEVYNPSLYRDYIHLGKMDYLYDKVELYDTLKHIIQGNGLTDNIPPIQEHLADIEHHMLHFLENHDEQRIASAEFAGSAIKAKPAMVVSATISTSPTMLYFGQEVGEPGADDAGFGTHSRTTIFDYFGVPNHQRWMNNGAFDGGQLTASEKDLRDFYKRLLNFTIKSSALMGKYAEIHSYNRSNTTNYNAKNFAFIRWNNAEKLLIVSNFDAEKSAEYRLQIPAEIIHQLKLTQASYTLQDQLYKTNEAKLTVEKEIGYVNISIQPLESFIFKIQ